MNNDLKGGYNYPVNNVNTYAQIETIAQTIVAKN